MTAPARAPRAATISPEFESWYNGVPKVFRYPGTFHVRFFRTVSLGVVKAPRTIHWLRKLCSRAGRLAALSLGSADEMAESAPTHDNGGRAIEISLHLDAQKISETAALGAVTVY